jgi:hypothetical protein
VLAEFTVTGRGLYLSNTIIARNGASKNSDCAGKIVTLGGNLIGTDDQCTVVGPDNRDPNWPMQAADLIGHGRISDTIIDAKFVEDPVGKPALRDNGGTSCTHALQQSSPAINTAWTGIPGSHPFACETYDQTWFKRGNATDPQGTGCDVGAFQFRETISPSGLGCTN